MRTIFNIYLFIISINSFRTDKFDVSKTKTTTKPRIFESPIVSIADDQIDLTLKPLNSSINTQTSQTFEQKTNCKQISIDKKMVWECSEFWEICQKECSNGPTCKITCTKFVDSISDDSLALKVNQTILPNKDLYGKLEIDKFDLNKNSHIIPSIELINNDQKSKSSIETNSKNQNLSTSLLNSTQNLGKNSFSKDFFNSTMTNVVNGQNKSGGFESISSNFSNFLQNSSNSSQLLFNSSLKNPILLLNLNKNLTNNQSIENNKTENSKIEKNATFQTENSKIEKNVTSQIGSDSTIQVILPLNTVNNNISTIQKPNILVNNDTINSTEAINIDNSTKQENLSAKNDSNSTIKSDDIQINQSISSNLDKNLTNFNVSSIDEKNDQNTKTEKNVQIDQKIQNDTNSLKNSTSSQILIQLENIEKPISSENDKTSDQNSTNNQIEAQESRLILTPNQKRAIDVNY